MAATIMWGGERMARWDRAAQTEYGHLNYGEMWQKYQAKWGNTPGMTESHLRDIHQRWKRIAAECRLP